MRSVQQISRMRVRQNTARPCTVSNIFREARKRQRRAHAGVREAPLYVVRDAIELRCSPVYVAKPAARVAMLPPVLRGRYYGAPHRYDFSASKMAHDGTAVSRLFCRALLAHRKRRLARWHAAQRAAAARVPATRRYASRPRDAMRLRALIRSAISSLRAKRRG